MPSARTSLTAQVVCADYGNTFELSRRNMLEHERHGMPHRCPGCRHPNAGPSPAMIQAAKGWWIRTYGLTEVRSWPPL